MEMFMSPRRFSMEWGCPNFARIIYRIRIQVTRSLSRRLPSKHNMLRDIFKRIKKVRQSKAVILMYHQVCERSDDPWELAVHPDNFQTQVSYLKKNFDVVSISELADGLAKQNLGRTVAISFDDGFRD